jgi:hypothetical protein
MALINCAECKKEISDAASSCPSCGHPVTKQTFAPPVQKKKKKFPKLALIPIIIIGVLLLLMIIGLLSSEGEQTHAPAAQTTMGVNVPPLYFPSVATTTEATTAQAPADSQNSRAINHVITLPNLTFTATEIRRSQGETFSRPNDGMEFIAVRFTIENTSSGPQGIPALVTFDTYVDGSRRLIALVSPYSPPIGGYTLQAGMRADNWHVVESPIGSREISIHFSDIFLSTQAGTQQAMTFQIP